MKTERERMIAGEYYNPADTELSTIVITSYSIHYTKLYEEVRQSPSHGNCLNCTNFISIAYFSLLMVR